MLISDLLEGNNNRDRKSGEKPPESNDYTIRFSRKYMKAVARYMNKPAHAKLLNDLVATLKTTGEITTNGVHPIGQTINSEYSSKDEKGWKSVYISMSDELRLVYKRHPDRTIEVKFGKPKDIGYFH